LPLLSLFLNSNVSDSSRKNDNNNNNFNYNIDSHQISPYSDPSSNLLSKHLSSRPSNDLSVIIKFHPKQNFDNFNQTTSSSYSDPSSNLLSESRSINDLSVIKSHPKQNFDNFNQTTSSPYSDRPNNNNNNPLSKSLLSTPVNDLNLSHYKHFNNFNQNLSYSDRRNNNSSSLLGNAPSVNQLTSGVVGANGSQVNGGDNKINVRDGNNNNSGNNNDNKNNNNNGNDNNNNNNNNKWLNFKQVLNLNENEKYTKLFDMFYPKVENFFRIRKQDVNHKKISKVIQTLLDCEDDMIFEIYMDDNVMNSQIGNVIKYLL
jgi:hypothetical protein